MTAVRSRRGRVVHAWAPAGSRRDLAPEDIPNITCGRKISGAFITDEPITCLACIEIESVGN